MALEQLSSRLQHLDGLDSAEASVEVLRGVLAGNVFDWGAKEVVDLMTEGLNFDQATSKLQRKPAFVFCDYTAIVIISRYKCYYLCYILSHSNV